MSSLIQLKLGDCVEVLGSFGESSIPTIVCDPPYGLEFMGSEWDNLTRNIMRPTSEADITRKERYGRSLVGRLSNLPDLGALGKVAQESQEWHRGWLGACHRVLVVGGTIKAFSATRTYHRMAAAMQDVGFVDIRLEAWAYGSGFPKSKNVALFIDKSLGATGNRGRAVPTASTHLPGGGKYGLEGEHLTGNPVPPYVPVTDKALTWNGWHTALKPSWEPVLVGRKPSP